MARDLMREERSYLNCLIGVRPADAEALRRALNSLDRTLSARSGDARALRRKGRALSALGRGEQGRRALDESLALELSAEAWAWRGESFLLDGLAPRALPDLDRAVEAAPRWPWARVLRAVCLLTAGEEARALRDLASAERHRGARRAALAVRALLEGQRGRPDRGVRLIERASRIGPTGWLYAVRGMLRRNLSDLAGSLGDFDAAERLDPSPWVYSQRADVLNRLGFYPKALKDLDTLSALAPGSPEPRIQAANIYFDQAFYDEALSSISAALALRPDDPHLLARRAKFLYVLNRLDAAAAHLSRASALAPDDEPLRFERLMVETLRGRRARVLRELDRGALAPPLADYLRGYLFCRARAWAKARAFFERASRRAEGKLADRAAYFALVARVLAERPGPGPKRAPELYLCGIGIRHPYQATVEALAALSRCGTLYNNIGDPQIMEFLGLFPGEIRAVRRVMGGTAMGRAKPIVSSLRRGETAGFVTRIHPFIYRRIANDLVRLCRERKRSFESFGAVSLTEILWGLAVSEGSPELGLPRSPRGLRVFDIDFLTRNPELLDPRVGTVVYCIADERRRRALCALLRERFGAQHSYYLLAGSGDKEDEVLRVGPSELEAALVGADMGALLYVPPYSGQARAAAVAPHMRSNALPDGAQYGAAAASPVAAKRLWICGLGTRPPGETTLEALRVFGSVGAVFADISDPKLLSWLRPYCLKLVRVASNSAAVARIVRAAREPGGAALAVWGHPQFGGGLAFEVERAARKAAVGLEVLGAVSPIASAFARTASFLGGDYGYQGIQSYRLDALIAEPGLLTTRLPLVTFSAQGRAGDWRRLAGIVRDAWGPDHEMILQPAGSSAMPRATPEGLARLKGPAVVLVNVGVPR